jgi:hypothetical protein
MPDAIVEKFIQIKLYVIKLAILAAPVKFMRGSGLECFRPGRS